MVEWRRVLGWFSVVLCCCGVSVHAAESLSFELVDRGFRLQCGGQVLGEFGVGDEQVLRPYFSNLRSLDGVLLTRSHPPVQGVDADDHATMHPGVWMGFGDLSGVDFWRNKGRMEFVRYVEDPMVLGERLRWVVEHRLWGGELELGRVTSSFEVWLGSGGWFLSWEMVFRAGPEGLVFGDQEEMGFGVRVATPLMEKRGGRIRNSQGMETAATSWGQEAVWCDYSAEIEGRRFGVMSMVGSGNFRGSWWHNRNYGLMVANAFGREAMGQGGVSRVRVEAGGELRLRYGAFFYGAEEGGVMYCESVYRAFLKAVP